MFPEKFRREALRRRLVGDCFRAVLAKLGDLAIVIRARPGAALAIETVFFVHLQERFETTGDAHLANGEPRRLDHGGQAGGDARWLPYFGVANGARLRPGRWRLSIAIRGWRWRTGRCAGT